MPRSRSTPNPNVVRAYCLLRYTGQCQSNVARMKAVPVRRHSPGSAPLIRLPAEFLQQVRPVASDDPPYLVVDLGDVEPAFSPPFPPGCRAVRFHVGGIDHLRVNRASVRGKLAEQAFPDATPRPSNKSVIDRGRTTIFGRPIRQPLFNTCTMKWTLLAGTTGSAFLIGNPTVPIS